MTIFSPKSLFIENSKVCEELKSHREDYWLKTSFAFALAEMAFNGATEQQLAGARAFISTFQNLWEKNISAPKLPIKTLDADKPFKTNL
jgi:hypothetical protein